MSFLLSLINIISVNLWVDFLWFFIRFLAFILTLLDEIHVFVIGYD